MQPWHIMFVMFFMIWILREMWLREVLQVVIDYDDPIYRRKV